MLPAQGKAKHFKEHRDASCPMPAHSPMGFKTALSRAARGRMLSSSWSKHWLQEEAAKASKAQRKKISIVPFIFSALRRYLDKRRVNSFRQEEDL